MSVDIAVNPVALINRPVQSNKPCYLLTYEDGAVAKNKIKRIITIDKPETNSSYVHLKGVMTELTEEEVISSYQEVLTTAPKELIIELMVPWHRVFSLRSLVFKAK
jgi:hypothetical protein